jgi:phosphoribosylpyrophosphate synthetase
MRLSGHQRDGYGGDPLLWLRAPGSPDKPEFRFRRSWLRSAGRFAPVVDHRLRTADQGFFSIPVDHLFAARFGGCPEAGLPNLTVSPDGGARRAFAVAQCRTRDGEQAALEANVASNERDQRCEGQNCLVVDDIIDTAGTPWTVEALKEKGAVKVYACAAHPVSGPAVERIENPSSKK